MTELHGNLSQPQRNRAMAGFRRGDFQVLVATNIAARGLGRGSYHPRDQLRCAQVPDDYVHRIGRTARMEAEGDAFVLVSPAEEKSLSAIERHIGQRLAPCHLAGLRLLIGWTGTRRRAGATGSQGNMETGKQGGMENARVTKRWSSSRRSPTGAGGSA